MGRHTRTQAKQRYRSSRSHRRCGHRREREPSYRVQGRERGTLRVLRRTMYEKISRAGKSKNLHRNPQEKTLLIRESFFYLEELGRNSDNVYYKI